MNTPDIAKATEFLWLEGRLIERYRFQHLFQNGSREAILRALQVYQNEDGGFGNALEPDIRGPISQPQHVEIAFHILDELKAFNDPMVQRACDYLQSITTEEGGVPYVLPTAMAYPHAPWWQTEENPPASLNPTAALVGLLHRHGIQHPWLEKATAYCWHKIEENGINEMHLARAVICFLDGVPDRARAEQILPTIKAQLLEKQLVALDPATAGYIFSPLDYAPRPTSIARQLFDDNSINQALEALVQGQQPDGGWSFAWEPWAPQTKPEWRGFITVASLTTLRDYGRLSYT